MGIDIIFESGLGAGMDVNDEVLTSLGAKSVSRESMLIKIRCTYVNVTNSIE